MDLKIVHGWKDLSAADQGASVALGNFDGVHLGHQQVICLAQEAARRLKTLSGVISFEPHPRRLFQPSAPAFRLMSVPQLARALNQMGVDRLFLLPFDFEMASLTDEGFADKVLAHGLNIRHVAVGFDISFGRGRTGSPNAMRTYGEQLGFEVSVADAVGDGEAKYSSTAVRDALRAGRPDLAMAQLGRPFAIEGVVRRGKQLGRTIGYPTANVLLADYVVPRLGVYATRTLLPDGRRLLGVANLGLNPTTGGETEPRLEVWLFDFAEDLYGQQIETQLIAFLRPEVKFDSLEIMVAQIERDAAQARAILGD